MNYNSTNHENKQALYYAIVSLMFLFAFIFALNKIYEPDTFWHLKLGQYMVTTHSFPYRDIFSNPLAGSRIYPVEWLYEVIGFLLYSSFGYTGLIISTAIVSGLTAVLLLLTMNRYKINAFIGFFVTSSVFIVAGYYFDVRPQIVTYLGIALFAYITSLPDIENKWVLWLIPFIMLAWVNMHPGAVFGIIFLSAWLMEGFISLLNRTLSAGIFLRRLALYCITLVTTVITPSTYHLYTFLLHHVVSLGSKSGLEYIFEFTPLSLSKTPFMFISLVIFTAVFLSGIFKMPLRHVLFGLVMIPMSFDMNRMVIMALIGIAPGIGIVIHGWFAKPGTLKKPSVFMTVVYSAIILSPFCYEFYQYKTDFVGYKGFGVQRQFYPKEAIDFILEHHIKGNIYNSINFGGALIYLGNPEIKDFIDTRLGPETMLLPEVIASISSQPLFDKLLEKYTVSYALVGTYLIINYSQLLSLPDWHLVYFDDYAEIYVKQGTGNDDLIKRYAYSVFNPYTFLYTEAPLLDPDEYFIQRGLLSDLQKLIKEVPYSAMVNLAYGLGVIYNNADYADGIKYIDRAKSIMPYNTRVLLWYGIEHGLHGDTGTMKKSFDAIQIISRYQGEGSPNMDKAYMHFIMGYYYYLSGMNKEAIGNLKKAIKLNPGLTRASRLLDSIQQ